MGGMQRLRASFASLSCRAAPKQECDYCSEEKRPRDFPARALPASCYAHLTVVCKACVQAALGAQLESKPLLEIGCPQCSLVWSRKHVTALLSPKDKKRYRQIDDRARGMSCVPVEMPETKSLDLLLKQGARFCPWCRFPFIKDGGCDYMSCE